MYNLAVRGLYEYKYTISYVAWVYLWSTRWRVIYKLQQPALGTLLRETNEPALSLDEEVKLRVGVVKGWLSVRNYSMGLSDQFHHAIITALRVCTGCTITPSDVGYTM